MLFAFPVLLGSLPLLAAQYCFHVLSLTDNVSNFCAAIFTESPLSETQNLFFFLMRCLDLQLAETSSKF